MMKMIESKAKYSLLIVCNKLSNIRNTEMIRYYLEEGKKVIIIVGEIENKVKTLRKEYRMFEKEKLLQVYQNNRFSEEFIIYDGKFSSESEIKKLRGVEDFNIEQFQIEHYNVNSNISLQAGAGSGKTTVMIDRIIYLMHIIADLKFEEIVMITFTTEATKNMRDKLQEKLIIRYKLTRRKEYLEWLEQVQEIRISTIHSFAKDMISNLGSRQGLGKEVVIRKFNYDRKQIIKTVLDEYFSENKISGNIIDNLKVPLYKFIKIVDSFIIKLEQEGIQYEDMPSLDFGESKYGNELLNDIFKNILVRVMGELKNKKRIENAVSLEDITRGLDQIIKYDDDTMIDRLQRIRYLFVDEFQDTDNTQIKMVAWIEKSFGANIFVVGDIKQSIYRFRGATYTAFEKLNDSVENIESGVTLNKNYRSAEEILNKLHIFFLKWKSCDLIPYEKQLLAMNKMKGELIIDKCAAQKAHKMVEIKKVINREYKSYRQISKDGENKDISVIVRTNNQAKELRKVFEELNVDYYMEVGGSFYTSKAVKDFKDLVGVLLYKNRPEYKMNHLMGPYCSIENSRLKIMSYAGREKELNEYLEKLLSEDGWDIWRKEIRLKPILSILRKIISQRKPEENIFSEYVDNQLSNGMKFEEAKRRALRESKQYRKNLNHLMDILRNNFSNEFISLSSLYSFLKLQISTNRNEDEVALDESELQGCIRCMTVHKSKGLQFDTVIIPYMDMPFSVDKASEMLVDFSSSPIKAGWNIVAGDKRFNNIYYDELRINEVNEAAKEETRLLYVAMTRVKKRLVLIKSYGRKKTKRDSWNDII